MPNLAAQALTGNNRLLNAPVCIACVPDGYIGAANTKELTTACSMWPASW